MKKVISFLDGKKTYAGIAAAVIYSLAITYGKVQSNDLIWGAIFTWTGVSLRLAIAGK